MDRTATFIVPTLVGLDPSGALGCGEEYGYYFVATGADEVMGSHVWGTPPTLPGGTYRVVEGRLCPVVAGVPPDYPMQAKPTV